MTALTAAVMRKLAADSLPFIRFDRLERFFPVRAEAWLTHATSAPWDDRLQEGDVAALPPDPHHRGTAICSSGPNVDDVVILGGPPNPEDRPLRLAKGPEPDAIGNPAYAAAPDLAADRFLTFAGWRDPANPHLGGDEDYLYRAFSELASAMSHSQPWEVLATDPNRPRFALPQPPAPAVYCEIDWAGAHPRAAKKAGLDDFAGQTVTRLDGFLQVTHHFLFPARQPLANQPGTRLMEGQWAAISLFYPAGAPGDKLDATGRPTALDVRTDALPVWAVFSVDAADARPNSEVWRVAEEAKLQGTHVKAWCTAGTHRFLRQADATEASPAPPDDWPPLDYEPGADVEGMGPVVFADSSAGAMGDDYNADWFGYIGFAQPLAIGLVIALFYLLISWIADLWEDDVTTKEIPHPGEPPVSTGSEAGNPDAGAPTPGAPADAPGGESAPGTWPTNEGHPEGFDVNYFDVRVVSRIPAGDKGAPDLQPPPWWGYTGRWGIKVPDQANAEWDSGFRRTDHAGRGWAYWQANDLLTRLAQEAPVPLDDPEPADDPKPGKP